MVESIHFAFDVESSLPLRVTNGFCLITNKHMFVVCCLASPLLSGAVPADQINLQLAKAK